MNIWTGAIAACLALLLGSPSYAAPTRVHWRREAGPVVVTVYDQTRDELWGNALRKLIDEWNAGIEGVQLTYTLDAANSNCGTGRGTHTVVVCVQENTQSNHLAETHQYHDGEHLLHAMIWMDPTRPDPARNHLACHELGHAIGVVHRDPSEKTTCMADGYAREAEHPDQADFDGVTSEHSHIH